MGLDHSNAFVRLTFDGLITFCFNRRFEPDSCEMGMVRVEDHLRRLIVTRINPDGREEWLYPPFVLNGRNEVIIEALYPRVPGVRTYPLSLTSSEFDPLSEANDPEDFRWVMDLQGERLHGRELRLKRGAENYLCRPRVVIPHGIFYTHSKTPHEYVRYSHKGNTGELRIGKIADKVGADIVSEHQRGDVKVRIRDKIEFTLPYDGLKTRYRIDVENLCFPNCAEYSDFTHYYKVAEDNDGIEFDVRPAAEAGTPGFTKSVADFIKETTGRRISGSGFENLVLDGPPQVCGTTFLSQTNVIP